MRPDAIRVGLVACGRVVQQGHAPAYAAIPGELAVVGLADPSPICRRVVGDLLGVPVEARFADHRQMLECRAPDVCVVATPTALHAPVIREILDARVAVVSEKPLAPTVEECLDLAARAARRRVGLGVLHNYLCAPRWRHVRDLVGAGVVGCPESVEIVAVETGPLPGFSEEALWRARLAVAGGGCLLDQGYHYFYLAEALLGGSVTEVHTLELRASGEVEDRASVRCRHAGGGTTDLYIDWTADRHQPTRLVVHGGAGKLEYEEGAPALVVRPARGSSFELPARSAEDDGFTEALPALIRAAARGATDIAAGLRVLGVIEACYARGQGVAAAVRASPLV